MSIFGKRSKRSRSHDTASEDGAQSTARDTDTESPPSEPPMSPAEESPRKVIVATPFEAEGGGFRVNR